MKKLALVLFGLGMFGITAGRAAVTQAAPALNAKTSAVDKAKITLPAPKEIITRYVAAIGGRDSILKHSSHHSIGAFEMAAQGLKGNLEVFASKPNKILVKIDLPDLGKMQQGYNGVVGWSIDPLIGPMLLKGKQLLQTRDQAEFYYVLHDEKDFQKMETVEIAEFQGKRCYKLKVIRKSGDESTEFFDVESGLLIGTISTQETPLGSMAVTSTLSNYKTFGGILTPTRLTQKVAGIEQIMTIQKVEYDNVPETTFAMPKEIQTLSE